MKLWITDLDNTLCNTDCLEGDISRIGELVLFEGVAKVFRVLTALQVPIVVLTKGDYTLQRSKLYQLGLLDIVDEVYVAENDAHKKELLQQILSTYKLDTCPKEAVVIGDRLDAEVLFGKEMGCTTIWFRFGKYTQDVQISADDVLVANSYEEVLAHIEML